MSIESWLVTWLWVPYLVKPPRLLIYLHCFQCWNVTSETLAKQIYELGLIIGIILGRWLLPRGEITRDQLSALLLGYVGTAADTLELFEVLDEEVVATVREVTEAVLGVYTWSLLQFCLVTTATTGKDNQIRITNNKVHVKLRGIVAGLWVVSEQERIFFFFFKFWNKHYQVILCCSINAQNNFHTCSGVVILWSQTYFSQAQPNLGWRRKLFMVWSHGW